MYISGGIIRMSVSSHQSARMKNDEWLTPPEILRQLGNFDLDPCAPVNAPWHIGTHQWTKEDDGLARVWLGRVWLNPPFGRQASKWMERMAQHGDGIALLAARTETEMFFRFVWAYADAVCFLRGRPHFYFVDGSRAPFNSGAPICLIAYGKQNVPFLKESTLGQTVILR